MKKNCTVEYMTMAPNKLHVQSIDAQNRISDAHEKSDADIEARHLLGRASVSDLKAPVVFCQGTAVTWQSQSGLCNVGDAQHRQIGRPLAEEARSG